MKNNKLFIELRKRNGPTQAEFAEKAGVARSTIADIERGRIGISKKVREKISKVFPAESGVFVEIYKQKNDNSNQGIKSGYTQGDEYSVRQKEFENAMEERAAKMRKEYKGDFIFNRSEVFAKIIEKQKVIAEKAIHILSIENPKYKAFRLSMLGIQSFEDMLNNVTFNEAINGLIRIQEAARNYIKHNSVNSMKTAMAEDFTKFEPYINIFEDLAKAMTNFAERLQEIAELTDIDPIEFDHYLSLSK